MEVAKRPPQISIWGGLFLSAISGGLMITGHPPFASWGVHLFSLVPLFLALGWGSKGWRVALGSFVCGIVFVGASYSWMTRFSDWSGSLSYVFWVLLTLYQTTFFLLFGVVFLAARRLAGDSGALLASPLVWVLCEHLASYGPFGIPEWVGHGQLHNPILHPVISTLGVNGATFAVVLFGVLPVLFFNDRKTLRPFLAASVCLAAVLSGAWLGARIAGSPTEKAHRKVALLQPFIAPDVLNDGTRGQEVLKAYIDATSDLLEEGTAPDLVFWSEMVFPFSFNEPGETRRTMTEALGDYSGELVLGGPERSGNDYFNAAYLFTGGEIAGVYQKMRLFPFGEYTPFRGLLGFLREDLPLKLRSQDYTSGKSAEPLKTRSGSIGMSICFESLYTDFIREEVANGSEVLVNLTNDGWFAGSSADESHLFVGSMRAVENGRYFLQIASSGITAVVDPSGRVLERSTPGKSSVLRATVPLMAGETLFTRLGRSRFVVLAGLTLVLLMLARGVKRSDERES